MIYNDDFYHLLKFQHEQKLNNSNIIFELSGKICTQRL